MPRPALVIAALGLFALLGLAIVQFGGEDAKGPARSTDTVVFGMALEPPGLDPSAGAAAAIGTVTVTAIFEGLTTIDEAGNVLPALAESWSVSDDGLRYRFRLREGVTFSDGTAFDSADVRFTFERNAGPRSTNKRKAYFTQIADIETPGPYEVVIRLERPNSFFLFNLAEPPSVIVAPESAATNATEPIGTGPYVLESWAKGSEIRLAPNPRFRAPGTLDIHHVIFRVFGDPAAQTAAMLAGDIDVMPNVEAKEALSEFASDPRFEVLTGTTEGEVILAMNNRRPPLDDLRVRRAIARAIDRRALIEGSEFGYGEPIGSHFAPHHPAYVDLTALSAYDPEEARALLAEAGYGDGVDLTLKMPPIAYARRSGEIIRDQLAKVDIRVSLEPLEWAQWLETVYARRNFDLSIVAHIEPMDISVYADPDYYFGYESEGFRVLWRSAREATDAGERHRYLGLAQRRLAEDQVNAFLFQLARVSVHKKGLEGLWRNAPLSISDFAALRWTD